MIVYDLPKINKFNSCRFVEFDLSNHYGRNLQNTLNYIKFIEAKNIRGYYLDTELKRIEEFENNGKKN